MEQTGWELDDFYRCSKCGCHNESCRCPDESAQDVEESTETFAQQAKADAVNRYSHLPDVGVHSAGGRMRRYTMQVRFGVAVPCIRDNGAWVAWEDVEKLVVAPAQQATNTGMDAIALLNRVAHHVGEIKWGCLRGLRRDIEWWAQRHHA